MQIITLAVAQLTIKGKATSASHLRVMAVLLCRSDGQSFLTPPPPGVRGLPKLIILNQPLLPRSENQGKLITARSHSVYACNEEPREITWKKSHERC